MHDNDSKTLVLYLGAFIALLLKSYIEAFLGWHLAASLGSLVQDYSVRKAQQSWHSMGMAWHGNNTIIRSHICMKALFYQKEFNNGRLLTPSKCPNLVMNSSAKLCRPCPCPA